MGSEPALTADEAAVLAVLPGPEAAVSLDALAQAVGRDRGTTRLALRVLVARRLARQEYRGPERYVYSRASGYYGGAMAGKLPFSDAAARACATCGRDLSDATFDQKLQEFRDTHGRDYCDKACWERRNADHAATE